MKTILGGIGTAVAIAVVIGFKFLGPSAEVAVKNATGMGWDEARKDFVAEISSVINTDYDVFVLSQTDRDNIAGCIADKSIGFLNTTDCSYLYNTATTSEVEHLAAQEKCMNNVQFSKKQEAFSVECLKAHIPANWSVMEKVFTGVYEDAYVEQGIAAPQAKQIGECMSRKLVALCNERKYPLVDQTATAPENLFIPVARYIPVFENDEGITTIMNECAPGTEVSSN